MMDYKQLEEWVRNGVKVWQPSNIYPTAKLGVDVSIGAYTEIGNSVEIGDQVRIGAMCFIPEGVTIEDKAWIGPRCTFTNDRFPPSVRENWEHTVVKRGARLGAAVTVVCGVTIGEGALVGAGSVVTKNIPPREIWAGVPARRIRNKEDI
jgi:acetyltransferase-like isoleucine patch superfamily enzyme